MAETNLINKVDVNANYGDASTPISFSSNNVTTTIIQGLTVEKTANKEYWVDGPLTYTIVITNNSGSSITDGVISDTLDTTLVKFDTEYGVEIDSVKTQNYKYNDGTLTVNLATIDNTQTSTITFQVLRVS